MTHPVVTALPVGVPITTPSEPPQFPQVVGGPVVGVPWLDGPMVGAPVEPEHAPTPMPSWVPIISVDEALESMRNQMPWLFRRVPEGQVPTPQAHGTEMSSVRSYGRPYSANRPVVSKPALGSPGGSTSSSSTSRSSTSESVPTLQRFEDELGATFDGDPFPSSKVDQIMGKMREMGFKEFSRDDARVAAENFGNDLSVDMIVERILGTWPC